jgi:hypothetical protein
MFLLACFLWNLVISICVYFKMRPIVIVIEFCNRSLSLVSFHDRMEDSQSIEFIMQRRIEQIPTSRMNRKTDKTALCCQGLVHHEWEVARESVSEVS